jgi:hypothetical protein
MAKNMAKFGKNGAKMAEIDKKWGEREFWELYFSPRRSVFYAKICFFMLKIWCFYAKKSDFFMLKSGFFMLKSAFFEILPVTIINMSEKRTKNHFSIKTLKKTQKKMSKM